MMCQRCGLILFTPRPEESDLAIKYDYVLEEGDTLAREELRRLVDQRPTRGRILADLLGGYVVPHSRRAVDVGGADGHCLAGLTDTFECGILDYEHRALWPGVRRLGNSLRDLNDDDVFDIVITCHTLEHIPDVRGVIRGIKRHLVKNGIVYVEVPLGCAGEIFTTDNFLTHVNFFSEGSLGFVLEASGLQIEYMRTMPRLGMNSYVPVVCAIARNVEGLRPQFLEAGARRTEDQLNMDLRRVVALANARLVMANPMAYLLALIRRVAISTISGLRR
jgi:SAM-dependent methyltransferase